MPPKKICPKMGVEKCLLQSVVILQDRRVGPGVTGACHDCMIFGSRGAKKILEITEITTYPSIFSDLPTALFLRVVILLSGVCKLCKIGFGRVATLMD